MTQRPGPAARYSHLLNQEADENRKASIVQSPRQDSTLGNRGIVGFFVGPLSTLAVVGLTYLLLSHHLASNLCVTPYTQQIDFTPHPGFANLSFKYDSLWDQILSANGGFLADTIFGITMFHQLHCLQLLRIGLQQAHHENEGDAVTDSLGHDMHANPEHYLHCLDYLRQGILCSADGTIEKTIDRKTPGRKLVDGYVRHRCGDSQKLYDMVEASL